VTKKSESALLDTARQVLLTGVPIVSVLMFIAVAIKVFRAAHMETSTTVAIVSSANVVALLKGVVVTLLPGFLAGLIAAAVWLWVRAMPGGPIRRTDAKQAVVGPNAVLLWSLLAIGFFTVPFIVYLLIVLPVALLTLLLLARWWTGWSATKYRRTRKVAGVVFWPVVWLINHVLLGRRTTAAIPFVRKSMVSISLVAAIASTLFLAISPEVWLPLRTIVITPEHSIAVGDHIVLRHQVAAYVLETDATKTTLLTDDPRAVITVSTATVAPYPAICIPKRSGPRWPLLRTSQLIGLDGDFPSPYAQCPERPS